MDIQTLSSTRSILERCPIDDEPIQVQVDADVVGDDYGDWQQVSVSFFCGHTLNDMQTALRHADQL